MSKMDRKLTYRSYLSSAQMQRYRFGNGWLLSNAKNLTCHAVFSVGALREASNQPLPWFEVCLSILEVV